MSKFIIGITGASGSVYAVRLLEELLKAEHEVHLVLTRNGQKVLDFETGYDLNALKTAHRRLVVHDSENLFAPIASGSFKTDGMAVIPCSMSTLGEIHAGVSKNLLGRAADVCLKERLKLVLVPRETPLNSIHLRNMLGLSEMGAILLPAMPGFYHKPQTLEDAVNFVVGRVMEALGVENTLYAKWEGN